MRGVSLALTTATALLSICDAASLEQWKSRSIYQVVVDRFGRPDGSTTAPCDQLHLRCNGTWVGLKNNLDYIQDMGFTAVQISPIVENIEEVTMVGDAYHGYYQNNIYGINHHFGTEDELKELVDELHRRDMYIIVDVVVNNMAQKFDNIFPPPVDYSLFNPFNNEDYFHPYCNVTEWANATNYQNCWLYPFGVALPDLRTEDQKVQDMLNSWIKELVSNYSIDGLRIDAAKHVNPDFLPSFVTASGVFALGEVLTGLTEDFCPYQTQEYLPGMPNYLEYYPLIEAFNAGSMSDIDGMRQKSRSDCVDTLALGSFVENHDMPRFAHYNADMAIAKNAMAYIILNDGMPLVYQGQEQHFSGGETPANREAVWLSGYNKTSELYVTTQKLNKARNTLIRLTNNTGSTYIDSKIQTLMTNENHLCQVKGPTGFQIVSCIVNHSSSGPSYTLSVGGFTAGDQVVELLTCGVSTADNTGNVTMFMNRGEPRAYVLQSLLAEMPGICNTTQDAETASKKEGAAASARTSLAIVFGFAVASAMMML